MAKSLQEQLLATGLVNTKQVKEANAALPGFRLPSTSPAMASLTKAQKIERWKLIREIPGTPIVDFARAGTTAKNLAEMPIAEVFPAI